MCLHILVFGVSPASDAKRQMGASAQKLEKLLNYLTFG